MQLNLFKLLQLNVTPIRNKSLLLRKNNIVAVTQMKSGKTTNTYKLNPNISEWKVII